MPIIRKYKGKLEILEELSDGSFHVRHQDGSESWQDKEGNLHRVGKPAVVRNDGTEEWYTRGLRHRIDGPAYLRTFKNQIGETLSERMWYLQDKRLNTFEVEGWLEKGSIDLSTDEGQTLFIARFA